MPFCGYYVRAANGETFLINTHAGKPCTIMASTTRFWSTPLFPGDGFYKLVQINILRIILFHFAFLVMRGHLQAQFEKIPVGAKIPNSRVQPLAIVKIDEPPDDLTGLPQV